MDFKRSIMLMFIVSVLVGTSLFAQTRVDAQQSESIVEIPLKNALGETLYKEAFNSKLYTYVGSNKCRFCHRNFFLGRKKDPHDSAMKSLFDSKQAGNPKCLVCHSTGFGVESGFVSIEQTPRLANVQCEGCHGPGSQHIKIAKKRRVGGGFLAGTDNPKRIEKMCKSCHTERWNRSYDNFHTAYNQYKRADPRKIKPKIEAP